MELRFSGADSLAASLADWPPEGRPVVQAAEKEKEKEPSPSSSGRLSASKHLHVPARLTLAGEHDDKLPKQRGNLLRWPRAQRVAHRAALLGCLQAHRLAVSQTRRLAGAHTCKCTARAGAFLAAIQLPF